MTTVAMVTVAMEAMVATTIVHMVVAMTTAATTTTPLLGDTMALAMVQVCNVLRDTFTVYMAVCYARCYMCIGYDYSNYQGQAATGGR
jgi:hypothetical protein